MQVPAISQQTLSIPPNCDDLDFGTVFPERVVAVMGDDVQSCVTVSVEYSLSTDDLVALIENSGFCRQQVCRTHCLRTQRHSTLCYYMTLHLDHDFMQTR